MKREGYQHGMVRTHAIVLPPWQLQPKATMNLIDELPTAGDFAKVSTKPTNHSKFTSKCRRPLCRECHSNPASKSMHKVKGSQKVRSSGKLEVSGGFSSAGLLNNYLRGEDYVDRVDFDYEYPVDIDDAGSEDRMSFEKVGFCDSREEYEGWCLVEA